MKNLLCMISLCIASLFCIAIVGCNSSERFNGCQCNCGCDECCCAVDGGCCDGGCCEACQCVCSSNCCEK